MIYKCMYVSITLLIYSLLQEFIIYIYKHLYNIYYDIAINTHIELRMYVYRYACMVTCDVFYAYINLKVGLECSVE